MRRRVPIAVSGIMALAALGLGVRPAAAEGHETIIVHPGQSIQEAVNDAHPGDTIQVEPGTYHESVLITTDGLTVRGTDSEDRKTVLEPPKSLPPNVCTNFTGGSGFCVFGQVDSNGNVVRYVRDDTIAGFKVLHFPGSGIFGYGTDGLEVSRVSAFNDGGYGVARFASKRTLFEDNQAAGNQEAGLYVGDSPDADTLVTDNSSWNNGFGVFVRHSHGVKVTDNNLWANCLGVFVVDDGQAGGAGDLTISDNSVHDNNKACPATHDTPPLSGGGIALLGAVRTLVDDNSVLRNNHGGTVASGGILLFSAHGLSGGSDPIDDTIRDNSALQNAPADIIWDGTGHGNRFTDNECDHSQPAGFCD